MKIGEFTESLKAKYPGYAPISMAPSLAMLEERARANGVPIEMYMQREREQRYTAIRDDGRRKLVYLVVNPAAWETGVYNIAEAAEMNRKFLIKGPVRPKPELLGEL